MFSDRFNDDQILQLVQSPPLVTTATANYTTINNLLATPLSLSPVGVTAVQKQFTPPSVYNWSIGVQQNIGFGTVLDVAYVGNSQKHLVNTRNLNAMNYGTNFLPSSIDTTVSGNRPLPSQFLRPYIGYGDINLSDRWRLLGPLEAINGLLLFGLSTAVMFAVMSRLITIRFHLNEVR